MKPSPVPTLSLAQLEAYDPQAPAGRGERRFLCPACGEGKPRDSSHRCLSVNLTSGVWHCHRCQTGGKLREYWAEREPETATRRERARQALAQVFALPPLPTASAGTVVPALPMVEQAAAAQAATGGSSHGAPDALTTNPLEISPTISSEGATAAVEPLGEGKGGGTPWRTELRALRRIQDSAGAAYLKQRGIPADLAQQSGVRYSGVWLGRPAVVFPMRDRHGRLVGAQGRYIDGFERPKARTVGTLGAFATVGAWDTAEIVLTEAPLDALSLAVCGLPAIAVMGCNLPAWLPRHCAFRPVVVAPDADAAGDNAAAAWTTPLLGLGARVRRLRPEGAKDWNELLLKVGVAVLRELLAMAE